MTRRVGPAPRYVTVGLLVLFGLALVISALALYADRQLFNSERFADHVQAALRQPEVSREAGTALSSALVKAQPDLIAVEPLLRDVSTAVAGSPAFGALARKAAFDVHASVFNRGRDNLALTVSGAGVLVIDVLEARAPGIAKQVPSGLKAKLASISDGPLGESFTDAAQIAHGVRALGWIALGLAVALLAAAVAFAADRRDAIRAAGLAGAAVGAVLLVVQQVVRALVVSKAQTDEAADAVRAIWDEFFGSLLTLSLALIVAGLVTAAVAESRLRPVSARQRLEAAWRWVSRPPRRPWVRALRAAALGLTGLLTVLDPLTAVRLVAFGAGVVLIALGADEVLALTARPVQAAEPEPRRVRRGLRPAATVALVLGALALPVLAALGTGNPAGVQAAAAITGCNGSVALCDRRVDEVVFPATHNSMSSPADNFLFPNQQSGITAQLEGGVRGLLIDTHLGYPTKKGVYTVLEPGGKSRAKLEQALGPQAVKEAERLRGRIGGPGTAKPKVYLCHGFCELGAIDAVTELRKIRDFLIANPREVLVLSIEDEVTPAETARVFKESDLLDLVWTGSIDPLPRLGDMVEQDRRVLVFGEEHTDTAAVPWYHPQFDTVKDTPYTLKTPRALLAPSGCTLDRGKLANPMLLLNQFVAATPPLPSAARKVNGASDIERHAQACDVRMRGGLGLIAVDHWREGDVVKAARDLNARAR